jgi:hypothetical protein
MFASVVGNLTAWVTSRRSTPQLSSARFTSACSSQASTGILFSETLVAEGAVAFAKACEPGLVGIVSKRCGQVLSERAEPQLVLVLESEFCQDVTCADHLQ